MGLFDPLWSLGSGSPSDICMLRTSNKYDLMIGGQVPGSLRMHAANVQKSCSVRGNGVKMMYSAQKE